MATVEMPELEPGLNLFPYPLPVSQSVSDTLKSIDGDYSRVYEIDGDGQEVEVDEMQFGRVYWIDITSDKVLTPYLAPPVRLPDGQLGFHRSTKLDD
jgi:hypothetical protein